jgi:hypothetical protein
MILKNTFKYKSADKYTKIKWIIIKFMLYRSYILHFRVRMVQLSKSLHPNVHICTYMYIYTHSVTFIYNYWALTLAMSSYHRNTAIQHK